MRRRLVCVAALMGICSLSAADSVEVPGREFRFRGKPIHPLLIKRFEPWISDERPPITVELNLTAAWQTNEFAGEFHTEADGRVLITLPERSSYAYRHLGVMGDGTHVLRSYDSGGGSGVFQALLFVRLRKGVAYLADGV